MNGWRSSFVLLSVVIVLAMLVVNVRHETRQLTVTLEQARAYEQQLQVEWSTRQVQQVAAAKNDKIAEVVSRQDMQRVDPSVTFYMTPEGAQAKPANLPAANTNSKAAVAATATAATPTATVTNAGVKP